VARGLHIDEEVEGLIGNSIPNAADRMLAMSRQIMVKTHFLVGDVKNGLSGFWRSRTSRIGLIYKDSRVRSSVKAD
jgi:hypothetical protein